MPMLLTKLMAAGLGSGLANAFCADTADNQTATGTNQATAFETSTAFVRFTTVASGTGCLLDNGARGDSQFIINAGANALSVYPHIGGTINQLAANAAFSIPAGSWAFFDRYTDTLWTAGNDAASSSFVSSGTTPTYGFATRTVQGKEGDIVSVKDFKNSNGVAVACDGVQDDTTGFQAAVDWFGSTAVQQRSGRLLIPGALLISSTVTIQNKSLILEGLGWGNTQDTAGHASFIKWNGSAGTPMLKIINCSGFGIRDLRFVGKSTAKPSAAINFNQQSGFGMESNWLTNVFIGSMSGDSSDDANQFTNGVLWDGLASNSAEYIFNNVHIRKCSGDGIHVGFSQNIDHTFNDLQIENCANGVYMCGNASGVNWRFSSCTVDINQPFLDDNSGNCNSYVNVVGYHSEAAGRLAILKGGSLCIIGGAFQLTSSLNADGKVVSAGGGGSNTISNLTLREFAFTQASSPPTAPFLDFAGSGGATGGKCIILDGMEAWTTYMTGGTNGLTVSTGDPTDVRIVYFRERMLSTAGTIPKSAFNVIGGRATSEEWDITRNDLSTRNGITRDYGDHGEYWERGSTTELITLSTSGATTDSSANLLPADSLIEAVVARVTTTITTATDWKLGDGTISGRFSAANATLTAGTTQVGTVHADQTGTSGPRQVAAAKLRITTTGTPGAGIIRVTVFYRKFVAHTS